MYQFSKNLKIVSLSLMLMGALALGIGFLSAPSTVEEAKAMVADAHGHGGHDTHDSHADDHARSWTILQISLPTNIILK